MKKKRVRKSIKKDIYKLAENAKELFKKRLFTPSNNSTKFSPPKITKQNIHLFPEVRKLRSITNRNEIYYLAKEDYKKLEALLEKLPSNIKDDLTYCWINMFFSSVVSSIVETTLKQQDEGMAELSRFYDIIKNVIEMNAFTGVKDEISFQGKYLSLCKFTLTFDEYNEGYKKTGNENFTSENGIVLSYMKQILNLAADSGIMEEMKRMIDAIPPNVYSKETLKNKNQSKKLLKSYANNLSKYLKKISASNKINIALTIGYLLLYSELVDGRNYQDPLDDTDKFQEEKLTNLVKGLLRD